MTLTASTIHRLPKVDLHRHLEAAVRLNTAREVAEQYGLDLPWQDPEAFRQCFQYAAGMNTFFSCFRKELWATEDIIQRVVEEAIEDAADDNLVYLELRFGTDHYRKHHDHCPHRVVELLCEVASRARVPTNLIMGISGGKQQTWEYVKPNLDILRDHAARPSAHIVGVDLCEGWFTDQELFQMVLREVRNLDAFPLTVHAGEGRTAWGMRAAIEEYGATRIGHGVGCWFDRDVLDLVTRRGIALEVCPTSNVHTGAIDPLEDSPALSLLHHGAKVTLNTDAPSISGDLTMTDEYTNALHSLGFSVSDLKAAFKNSIEAAFISSAEKRKLWTLASSEWDRALREAETNGTGQAAGMDGDPASRFPHQ